MEPSPPTDAPASFADFALDLRLRTAVAALGWVAPTPIQAAVMTHLLAGRDVIGRARTGSGKTAAFGLPLLERLKAGGGKVRGLVLCPTRELALQVADALASFSDALPLEITCIYGGVPYRQQIRALKTGADLVVGTPGRLIDLLSQGQLDLSHVDAVVIDEADEMLRMGFIEDVTHLLEATAEGRQVALFSATMPPPIQAVAKRLSDPIQVMVEDRALSVGHIKQLWLAVPERNKLDALERVLQGLAFGTTLVFTQTRQACAETADALAKRGLAVDALHGDLNQAARERVLQRLRARQLRIVIATDVASRGIDVDHISHVINYDLPPEAESYVHRIGRTSRAANRGTAITFCTPRQVSRLKYFQSATGSKITQVPVPSDADIARRQRDRLMEDLAEMMEAGCSPAANAWLAQVLEERGWEPLQVAEAAIHLLAVREGTELDEMPAEGVPDWAAPPARKSFQASNEVELFVPVGYANKVTPADLVGALTNEGGLSGRDIGRISIMPRKTFVGMSEGAAREVLANTSTLNLRNKPAPVTLARPQPPRENELPRYEGPPGHKNKGRNDQVRPSLRDRQAKDGGRAPIQRRAPKGAQRGG